MKINLSAKEISEITIGDESINISLHNCKHFNLTKYDTLNLNEQKIDIPRIISETKRLRKKTIKIYNEKHKGIHKIYFINVILTKEHKGGTAFRNELSDGHLSPMYIKMNLNYLKNFDNFLFTLGHEFAHFYKYLDVKPMAKKEIIIRKSIYWLELILFILFVMITSSVNAILLMKSQEVLLGALVLIIPMISLIDFLDRQFYYIFNFESIWLKHQEEYLCDKEAYRNKNIDLIKTVIGEKYFFVHQNSNTHPSNKNRKKFLKSHKMRFPLYYGSYYHLKIPTENLLDLLWELIKKCHSTINPKKQELEYYEYNFNSWRY